ncbi:MAG: hypothetical protein ACREBU_09870 [Nitrososphaera sp.]
MLRTQSKRINNATQKIVTMIFLVALLALAIIGLASLSVEQRRTIEAMQRRINSLGSEIDRLQSQLTEMRLEYQSDINQINAQIQSIVMEINTLKREHQASPEMIKALDDLEFRMREMIRKKKEAMQYAR